MSTMVDLSPELERFAEGCVSSGRFSDMREVVESALVMLRDAEARRATFVASLEDARADTESHGYYTLEEVDAKLRATVAEARLRRA